MDPVEFEQVNRTLLKPDGWTDKECKPLPIFTDREKCVSKWKMTWRERFHCLFRGFLWLTVHSGSTQPPVLINAQWTVFSAGRR